MKNRIGIIVGILICVALSVGLILVKNQADKQKEDDTKRIMDFSNQWVEVNKSWDDQKSVTALLEQDLDKQKKSFVELTNNYSKVASDLAQATTDLTKTQEALKAREEDVAQRDAKINALEARNEALDKQALDLSTSITNLNNQITEARRKLAASEGDKVFLEGELKRLIAEKAELERQFNDLAVLRDQIHRLKEEMAVARRLDWIRRGILGRADEHGAQRLIEGTTPSNQPHKPKPSYDLNVEVNSDGSVRVIPPATNAPATPPAK
jgi:septal ring factor EnvC (AmiA/AmiB activator)